MNSVYKEHKVKIKMVHELWLYTGKNEVFIGL